ncbi:hypothetical protein ACKVMT_00125 [Halobacteriales archaeon Cl-PHB]
MPKRRRTVLAALAGSLTTTGCLGFLSSEDRDGNQTPAVTATPTASVTPTASPTTTSTATETVPGRVADEPCPSFDGEQTVCTPTRPGDVEVYLTPSTYVFEPVEGNDSVETMTLTLHNNAEGRFTVEADSWDVHQRRNGTWETVERGDDTGQETTLDPGETYDWVLSRESHPTPTAENTTYVTADLDSALTAVAVYGQAGTMQPILECIALFDVAVMVAD